jgi:alkylation response protein AidB-like acyl-CoA dehydrogenase
MELDLSESERLLKKTIRSFREEEMQPLLDGLDADATHLPKADQAQLRETAKDAGLWGLLYPESFGGAGGLSHVERTVFLEELSKHRLGLYNPGLGAVELAPGNIAGLREDYREAANDHLMDTYIRPGMRGELVGSFAWTEPAAGTDRKGIQTRAEMDGDEWVINGEKRFITKAGWANYTILFARGVVDGEDQGITAFFVNADADGWNINRQIDTIRPLDPFEISIDDLRVPDENRFGPVGGAFDLGKSGIQQLRIEYSAQHVGVASHALEMAIEYARERETFGKPLADRQAIQWMIADSLVDIHTSRLAVYECAYKADQGLDVDMEASMIKLETSLVLQDVLDRVIQIHGGIGVTKDLPLERWFRESRVRRIGEGPDEIHRMNIAEKLLDGSEPVDLLEER